MYEKLKYFYYLKNANRELGVTISFLLPIDKN